MQVTASLVSALAWLPDAAGLPRLTDLAALSLDRPGSVPRAATGEEARDALFSSVIWTLLGLVGVAAAAILLDLFRKRGTRPAAESPEPSAERPEPAAERPEPSESAQETPREGPQTRV